MKYSVENLKKIQAIVSENKTIAKRESALSAAGFTTGTYAMGSGGLFNTKKLKSETRIQASYGTGKHNYALCVVLEN